MYRAIANPGLANYYWVSNDELLYLNPQTSPPQIILHHIRTGAETPRPIPSIPGMLDTFGFQSGSKLSPDGHRLLVYLPRSNASSNAVAIVPSLTSASPESLVQRWLVGRSNPVFWLPDSRHFLFLKTIDKFGTYEAVIYDADDPSKQEKRRFTTLSHASDLWAPMITPEGRILNYSDAPKSRPKIEEYPLFETSHTPRVTFSAADMPGSYMRYVERISPDGKSLLWILGREENPFLSMLAPVLQQFPGVAHPLQNRFSHGGDYVCVTDRDGGNLRIVGRKGDSFHPNVIPSNFPSSSERIEDLRWTPDSKHISFIYQRKLYVRPIP